MYGNVECICITFKFKIFEQFRNFNLTYSLIIWMQFSINLMDAIFLIG